MTRWQEFQKWEYEFLVPFAIKHGGRPDALEFYDWYDALREMNL